MVVNTALHKTFFFYFTPTPISPSQHGQFSEMLRFVFQQHLNSPILDLLATPALGPYTLLKIKGKALHLPIVLLNIHITWHFRKLSMQLTMSTKSLEYEINQLKHSCNKTTEGFFNSVKVKWEPKRLIFQETFPILYPQRIVKPLASITTF